MMVFCAWRGVVRELVGTAFFVFVSVGIASVGEPGRALAAFGFGMAANAVCFVLPGAQINPWITAGLAATREISPSQAASNVVAQLAGGLAGAGALLGVGADVASGATVAFAPAWNCFCGEAISVCFLVLTAISTVRSVFAPIAVGLAVMLGNAFLIPLDNASLNLARSLGPAVVSGRWGSGWALCFVAAPLVGALVAVPVAWACRVGSSPPRLYRTEDGVGASV